MAIGSSAVVEHSPQHLKLEGSITASSAAERENCDKVVVYMVSNGSIVVNTWLTIPILRVRVL